MELPRGYISYSQIRLYQTCPKKYYYIYVKKISVPVNEKVFLGIVFHSVIETYFKEKINGVELSKEVLSEKFKETFTRLQEEQEVTWENPSEVTFKRGNSFVKYFLHDIAPSVQPLMVEKELIAQLPELDVSLKGVIDLVENDFSITDFKTTTARWSKSKIKNHYLQVVIYRYLFEKTFGDVISNLKFKIIYSKNPPTVRHQEIVVKPKDVDYNYSKMFDVIKYVVDNIRQEIFYKNESYICSFCEHKEICRSET